MPLSSIHEIFIYMYTDIYAYTYDFYVTGSQMCNNHDT